MAIVKLNAANGLTGTIPQGNIANASLNAVTSLPAAIPTGKVLQVVHKNLTSDLSTNSTSYQDLDSQVFTPTSSSSKVFIMTTNHIFIGGSNAANYRGAQIKILRDSTTIANDGNTTSKYGSSYHLSDADDRLFLFHTIYHNLFEFLVESHTHTSITITQ